MGKLQGFFNEVSDECKYLKELYDNSVSYVNTKDPEAYQFFVDKVGEEQEQNVPHQGIIRWSEDIGQSLGNDV